MHLERRYEWIVYPAAAPSTTDWLWWPQYAGFRMQVLISPSLAELRRETRLYTTSAGPDTAAQDAWFQYVAPWVLAWTLKRRTDAGDLVDVLAPGQVGGSWENFLALEYELLIWVRQVLHLGYLREWRDALQNITHTRRPLMVKHPTELPKPNC